MDILPSEEEQMMKNVAREFLEAEISTAMVREMVLYDLGFPPALWQQMGSPQQPTPEQYAQLEKAGQLATMRATETVQVENGTATIRLQLPRQAVSLVVLEWSARTR